jgi:TusA-related sulfurtransferase
VPAATDLDDLGLDSGGHLLLERALAGIEPGDVVEVRGRHPALAIHLAAWCRRHGHRFDEQPQRFSVIKGTAERDRWSGAVRAGSGSGPPEQQAQARWGLAARGALVEQGGPPIASDLAGRDLVWADAAPRLYAAACASQWDPATAVDWNAPTGLAPDIEAAVVQLMTYMVENEQAALLIPARLLARVHPHFREVLQLLAIQAADEARHIEVFTRRAQLAGGEMGVSGAGGRASLDTLLQEHDFTLAGFLLSVLGEGTFLDLLRFLNRYAPDPITRDICRLALSDESRHVAFGVAHTAHAAAADPALLARLRAAVERRHSVLLNTAGLNQNVFDALVILAAGSWTPDALRSGWAAVVELQAQMDEGRRRRLARIGFPDDEAAEISALHTRNFM